MTRYITTAFMLAALLNMGGCNDSQDNSTKDGGKSNTTNATKDAINGPRPRTAPSDSSPDKELSNVIATPTGEFKLGTQVRLGQGADPRKPQTFYPTPLVTDITTKVRRPLSSFMETKDRGITRFQFSSVQEFGTTQSSSGFAASGHFSGDFGLTRIRANASYSQQHELNEVKNRVRLSGHLYKELVSEFIGALSPETYLDAIKDAGDTEAFLKTHGTHYVCQVDKCLEVTVALDFQFDSSVARQDAQWAADVFFQYSTASGGLDASGHQRFANALSKATLVANGSIVGANIPIEPKTIVFPQAIAVPSPEATKVSQKDGASKGTASSPEVAPPAASQIEDFKVWFEGIFKEAQKLPTQRLEPVRYFVRPYPVAQSAAEELAKLFSLETSYSQLYSEILKTEDLLLKLDYFTQNSGPIRRATAEQKIDLFNKWILVLSDHRAMLYGVGRKLFNHQARGEVVEIQKIQNAEFDTVNFKRLKIATGPVRSILWNPDDERESIMLPSAANVKWPLPTILVWPRDMKVYGGGGADHLPWDITVNYTVTSGPVSKRVKSEKPLGKHNNKILYGEDLTNGKVLMSGQSTDPVPLHVASMDEMIAFGFVMPAYSYNGAAYVRYEYSLPAERALYWIDKMINGQGQYDVILRDDANHKHRLGDANREPYIWYVPTLRISLEW